jgi:hypothetical protein
MATGSETLPGISPARSGRLDCVESLKLPVLIPVIRQVQFVRQVQFAAVVKPVRTMLCTWGRGRPWGLVWCSKEATTQCCGFIDENRVRPVPCMNSVPRADPRMDRGTVNLRLPGRRRGPRPAADTPKNSIIFPSFKQTPESAQQSSHESGQ